MSKIVISLKKSGIIGAVIHLVGYLVFYFYNHIESGDVLVVLPLTFSHFFIAPFLSYYFFNPENKKPKNIVKPSILAFLITFWIIFIYFMVIKNEVVLLKPVSILNGIISFFVALFFTLFQRINVNSKEINYSDIKRLKYSHKKLFSIPFSGVLIYCVIIVISNFFDFYISEILMVVSIFFSIGFILSILSIHFFNYLYSKYRGGKRNIYVTLYYIITISIIVFWIIVSSNNFQIVKSNDIGATLDRMFLIPTVLLYSPYFLYVLVLTHLYFISLLLKQEKKLLKQQTLENQLNYQQLKNQLSPHFLFNNLNVLTGLIEENPRQAIYFSKKLSNIYRYFLEQEKQDVVLLKEELNFAKDYIELLKYRFENGLEFSIKTSEESSAKYIVATSLQQILENVIKHNEVSKDYEITISITDKDGYLIVSNNKNPKIINVKSNQNGLENIQKRYAYFSDKKVEITQDENQFSIQLPLLTL